MPPDPPGRGTRHPAGEPYRIFEPFFTTTHRGTGPGLPTVRRLINLHGGTIEADCPAEGRAVITILLPVTAPGATAAPQASTPERRVVATR